MLAPHYAPTFFTQQTRPRTLEGRDERSGYLYFYTLRLSPTCFDARTALERSGALASTAGGDSGCPSRGACAGAASPSAGKLASRSPSERRVAGAQGAAGTRAPPT